MTLRQHVGMKMSSGKWLLTMAAAICLVVFALARVFGKPSLPETSFGMLILYAFQAYFAKKTEPPEQLAPDVDARLAQVGKDLKVRYNWVQWIWKADATVWAIPERVTNPGEGWRANDSPVPEDADVRPAMLWFSVANPGTIRWLPIGMDPGADWYTLSGREEGGR